MLMHVARRPGESHSRRRAANIIMRAVISPQLQHTQPGLSTTVPTPPPWSVRELRTYAFLSS